MHTIIISEKRHHVFEEEYRDAYGRVLEGVKGREKC